MLPSDGWKPGLDGVVAGSCRQLRAGGGGVPALAVAKLEYGPWISRRDTHKVNIGSLQKPNKARQDKVWYRF